MWEAYSHEVSSAGYWPGPDGEGVFYSYAYPEPDGYRSTPVAPAGASFDDALGEFTLPYTAVRTAPDPDAVLLEFLQSTYEAAADDRRLGPGQPRAKVWTPELGIPNMQSMDPRTVVIERETQLARSADEVWQRVTTPAGINHELGPWLRMTVPTTWRGSSLADVAPGSQLGRSWVLLLAVVPIDYDDLGIDAIGDRYFRERSTMATARTWQHERWVDPDEGDPDRACIVRDRIEYVPRPWLAAIPGAARAQRAILTAVFRQRHRQLRAWSAGTTSAS